MAITDNHLKEFESFLDISNPKELRKTIQTLYFSFTMSKENKGLLPENFDEMSGEIFHLLEFVERLEEIASRKPVFKQKT